MTYMVFVSILFIRVYQFFLSPDHSPLFSRRVRVCRFFPSCSTYTMEALQHKGFVRGWWYGVKRIARCHPWQEGGYDPLPRKSGGA